MPLYEFELVKRETLILFSETTDPYYQNGIRWLIGIDEVTRGRLNEARNLARELMQVGQSLDDPRSIGLSLLLLSMIALASGSYADALEYSEQSLSVAITPNEQINASGGRAWALVALGRIEEGARVLEEFRSHCYANGHVYALNGSEVALGICKIFQGRIANGLHVLEKAISNGEKYGFKIWADAHRLVLAEVYLQIIAGGDLNAKVPLATLLRNLPVLLNVMLTARSRIRALISRVLENSHFDPAGVHVGHAKMILGLLYKSKKKRALAVQHLSEAKCILSQFGQTPILARVDTALAELKQ